ncbi:unnamed protein product, partial [Tetraodon nigroviridis]
VSRRALRSLQLRPAALTCCLKSRLNPWVSLGRMENKGSCPGTCKSSALISLHFPPAISRLTHMHIYKVDFNAPFFVLFFPTCCCNEPKTNGDEEQKMVTSSQLFPLCCSSFVEIRQNLKKKKNKSNSLCSSGSY